MALHARLLVDHAVAGPAEKLALAGQASHHRIVVAHEAPGKFLVLVVVVDGRLPAKQEISGSSRLVCCYQTRSQGRDIRRQCPLQIFMCPEKFVSNILV